MQNFWIYVFWKLSKLPIERSKTYYKKISISNLVKTMLQLVSKNECVIFHLRFRFAFFFKFTFCSTKSMDSSSLKCRNLFKNDVVEKPHTALLPDMWFFSYNKKVLKFTDIYVKWSSQKLTY